MKYLPSLIIALFCLTSCSSWMKSRDTRIIGTWTKSQDQYSVRVLKNGADVTDEIELFEGEEIPPSRLIISSGRYLCLLPIYGESGIEKVMIYDLTGCVVHDNSETIRLFSKDVLRKPIEARNPENLLRPWAINVSFKLETGELFDMYSSYFFHDEGGTQ